MQRMTCVIVQVGLSARRGGDAGTQVERQALHVEDVPQEAAEATHAYQATAA